jgi:3-hydroxyisobutyrate dehydrogenase-like beta-hydroxyacid dehydrogenase
MKIGIVGLGRMGAAMCQRLRQNGCDITAWDRNSATMSRLAAAGVTLAQNARAVASETDIVISIVTADDDVRGVFNGPNGFLSGDVAGKLFIDMTTLQPMTARELAPLVEAKGARLIESPVLGTIPQVRDGKLFALVGGKAEDVERARPVLELLTRRIMHMGPAGSGYAMKLAVNLGLGAYIQAISESLALGMQQGLGLDAMLEVLQEAPYASGWMKSKIGVIKGEPPEMTLDIRTLRKDIMSAVATGALSGVPMPLSAGTLAALSAAVASGKGSGDLGEMPKFLREQMVQKFG